MGLLEKRVFHSRGVSSMTRLAGCSLMRAHHIHQVGVGIHTLEPAGNQEALDDTDAFGADLRPGEQPVLLSLGDGAQGALQVVGVDRHRGIGKEHLKAGLACQGIVQGLGQGLLGSVTGYFRPLLIRECQV